MHRGRPSDRPDAARRERVAVLPGRPRCSITAHGSIEATGYNTAHISLGSHQGTHVDAPSHVLLDGATVDELPLQQLCGAAIPVDLMSKAPGEPIWPADFGPASSAIIPGSRVVYRTDWDKRLEAPDYFTGMPVLSLDAAVWLAERRLALLGMDTPTLNPADDLRVHRALLAAGTVLLEGLANLSALRSGPFQLVAAPLRLRGCDGAPVRAFGIQSGWPDQET